MPEDARTRSRRVDFSGHDGALLAARLELPAGPPRAYALFAHCFTCSKDSFAASRIARNLANHGFATLRFDFTGLGGSEGDFANTNFTSNVEDLVAAANYLESTAEGPSILVGHSLGGAAVLAVADRLPSVRGVVTLGAPADPAHVEHLMSESVAEIEAAGSAEVTIAGRSFRIATHFLEDIRGASLEEKIGGLRRALLVMHAPRDEIVALDNAATIFKAARHPKSFVSIDGGDHLLRNHSDARWVANVIATWADRYLEAPEEALSAPDASTVRVQTLDPQVGYAQAVAVGDRHMLLADEPASVGGEDRGPSPYDLLLSALGTCTTMTLQMYSRRKGWPLERVTVDLTHRKVHADDCAECTHETGYLDRIERHLELVGELDETQRARLVEIADRCPVHRTLHGQVRVVTELVEAERETLP